MADGKKVTIWLLSIFAVLAVAAIIVLALRPWASAPAGGPAASTSTKPSGASSGAGQPSKKVVPPTSTTAAVSTRPTQVPPRPAAPQAITGPALAAAPVQPAQPGQTSSGPGSTRPLSQVASESLAAAMAASSASAAAAKTLAAGKPAGPMAPGGVDIVQSGPASMIAPGNQDVLAHVMPTAIQSAGQVDSALADDSTALLAYLQPSLAKTMADGLRLPTMAAFEDTKEATAKKRVEAMRTNMLLQGAAEVGADQLLAAGPLMTVTRDMIKRSVLAQDDVQRPYLAPVPMRNLYNPQVIRESAVPCAASADVYGMLSGPPSMPLLPGYADYQTSLQCGGSCAAGER